MRRRSRSLLYSCAVLLARCCPRCCCLFPQFYHKLLWHFTIQFDTSCLLDWSNNPRIHLTGHDRWWSSPGYSEPRLTRMPWLLCSDTKSDTSSPTTRGKSSPRYTRVHRVIVVAGAMTAVVRAGRVHAHHSHRFSRELRRSG